MSKQETQSLQSKLTTWTLIRDIEGIKELLFTFPEMADISLEQFDKLEAQWNNYMAQLETEFDTEKRKEFILSKFRGRIIKLDAREKETLVEYEQQRINNIPFSERKVLMNKIEMIKRMKIESLEAGKKMKEIQVLKLDWIDPLLDREKIRSKGFESFFKKHWEVSI